MKIIDTGVAKILVIKMPQHTTGWSIGSGVICHDSIELKLPPGDWKPLGIDTELTEEQCRPLFKHKDGYGLSFELPLPNNRAAYFSAKEAFASLMQAHGCYSVNPCTHPSKLSPLGYNKNKQIWQQAEDNTGPHLILKNIL